MNENNNVNNFNNNIVNNNLQNSNSATTVTPYHATENLNVHLNNNANVSMHDALAVNMQNVSGQEITMPGFSNQNVNSIEPNISQGLAVQDSVNQNIINAEVNTINTSSVGGITDNQTDSTKQQILYDTTSQINNKPVERKRRNAKIQINSELKFALLIALILLIFIMFMPSIVEFFR